MFSPPRLEFLVNIKKMLILFQFASGLQVNFHKGGNLGINLDVAWLQDFARSLLCKVGNFPFTYFGIPIGGCLNHHHSWKPILDRMEKKLTSYKGKLLSMGI